MNAPNEIADVNAGRRRCGGQLAPNPGAAEKALGHMVRTSFILFVASILWTGCHTARSEYSPDAWAAWQKCCKIKKGMTYSEVYAILPSAGRFKIGDSHELESWFIVFGSVATDHVGMTLEYDADGRVVKIDRNIEHGIQIAIPHVDKIQ